MADEEAGQCGGTRLSRGKNFRNHEGHEGECRIHHGDAETRRRANLRNWIHADAALAGLFLKITLTPSRQRSSTPTSVQLISGDKYFNTVSTAGCTRSAGATRNSSGGPGESRTSL